MKRTVLLTGSTGFLGSNLAKRLCSLHNVVIAKRSFSKVSRIVDIMELIKCYDIDKVSFDRIFYENSIDVILHTATNYGRGNASLSEVLHDNLIMPLKLAEVGTGHGCTSFINTDTFFCKFDTSYHYLKNYTISKRLFLEAVRALSLKVVNCRLEHVYGPGDDESKFVSTMISQIKANKKHIDLTDGTQRRDFVFIDDVVNAYVAILSNLNTLPHFSDFEVGTGASTSLRDFVTLIKKNLNSSPTDLRWGVLEKRQGEFLESKADITGLTAIGWTSQTTLEDGVVKTINYP